MEPLGGTECDVLHDFKLINREAAALGLQLNHHKSELIFEELAGTDILNATPDLCKVSRENATLLGSPIGLSHSINVAITDKVNALKTMGSRLCRFSKHDALLLLRSFAIPKILYMLKTAPCFSSSCLET